MNLTDEEMDEYTEMVKDMQDVYIDWEGGEEEEEWGDEAPHNNIPGMGVPEKFLLDDKTLQLPGTEQGQASVGHVAECLRVFLSGELGDDLFLKIYKRMEQLADDEDEDIVVSEIYELMGVDKIRYLALIHQLIICEDTLNQQNISP
mmetsp:Transcript_17179/g.54951  ORF Transcript_17179/g.54951 Transcript_17179/m.54951 type:complete len:147 (+) Transcript_17179:588-1028(+)